MTKRSGFQFKKPRPKIPKLDIQIHSSQTYVASQTVASQQNAPAHRLAAPRQPAPESDDMWGDEDDSDFIMLASQVADRVEERFDVVLSQSLNFSVGNDLSYGLFQREVDASTQLRMPIKNTEINDLMSGDEEDFLNIPMPEKAGDIDKTLQPSTSNNNQKNDALKNAQIEAQATYLQTKIREQKKQIETLKESLTKSSEKCQQKEGEASSLRYELKLKQQMNDNLRKEKMAEIGALESKYTDKVNKLKKALEAQKNESEFKVSSMGWDMHYCSFCSRIKFFFL